MKYKKHLIVGAAITITVMVILFVTFLFLLRSNMVPSQVPLTAQENKYIDSLHTACHCPVRREFSPHTIDESKKDAWYAISFDRVSHDQFLKKDSLSLVAERVARNINSRILNDTSRYTYKHILVVFNYRIKKRLERSEDFEFHYDD